MPQSGRSAAARGGRAWSTQPSQPWKGRDPDGETGHLAGCDAQASGEHDDAAAELQDVRPSGPSRRARAITAGR